jgi:hypothetical protein
MRQLSRDERQESIAWGWPCGSPPASMEGPPLVLLDGGGEADRPRDAKRPAAVVGGGGRELGLVTAPR